jgi:hypothetical protein
MEGAGDKQVEAEPPYAQTSGAMPGILRVRKQGSGIHQEKTSKYDNDLFYIM